MSHQETIRVLRKARSLISETSRWTKGEMARNADGDATDEKSELAVCWCAEGAVCRAAGGLTDVAWSAIQALKKTLNGDSVYLINDDPGTSHLGMLTTFNLTIARLESGDGD